MTLCRCLPLGAAGTLAYTVPEPPCIEGPRFDGVREALADGSKSFEALMAAMRCATARTIRAAV